MLEQKDKAVETAVEVSQRNGQRERARNRC